MTKQINFKADFLEKWYPTVFRCQSNLAAISFLPKRHLSFFPQDYYELANSHAYRPPTFTSYDELERKYWKSLSFCPPIYGCDVAAHLTDPDVKEWNIANLGSVLDLIKEDSELDIKVHMSKFTRLVQKC